MRAAPTAIDWPTPFAWRSLKPRVSVSWTRRSKRISGRLRNRRGTKTGPFRSLVPSRISSGVASRVEALYRGRQPRSRFASAADSISPGPMPGPRRSSASSTRMWLPVARSTPTFRAAAKSSVQGVSSTVAPAARAISLVRSLLPVSTTMVSWQMPRTLSRQPSMKDSSLRAIMQREIVGRLIPQECEPGPLRWKGPGANRRARCSAPSRWRSISGASRGRGRPSPPSHRTREGSRAWCPSALRLRRRASPARRGPCRRRARPPRSCGSRG